MQTDSRYQYEQLASFITRLVNDGILQPGSRAPSLRQISRQHRVSISTALHAYRLLESRRVLEARPQSGHYVLGGGTGSAGRAEIPALSGPPASSTRSVILKLLECARDPAIVPLACAIPSAQLLASARLDRFLARAARVTGNDHNRYTLPKGDLRLRQELAKRALRWGQVLSPEDIAITCGCTEALTLALRVVSRPGDTIAIESPTYFGIFSMLEALNLRALELPTDPNNGIDLSVLAQRLTNNAVQACLVSSSFANPLGHTLPDEKKSALLRLLAAHDVPLIEDDIHGDIHFGPDRPKPFIALDPIGNTLYCSSLSKTVAPGYRIGWIATTRRMEQVLERKFAFTLSGAALPQAAMADFLSSGGYDNHLRRLRRTCADNIHRMIHTIEMSFPNDTKVTRPEGGFVVWVELPEPLQTHELLESALEHRICFAPGEIFSASGLYANCLRLSCAHAWQPRIEQGLIKLGRLARAAASDLLQSHHLQTRLPRYP